MFGRYTKRDALAGFGQEMSIDDEVKLLRAMVAEMEKTATYMKWGLLLGIPLTAVVAGFVAKRYL